jgi:hypothetical protein
MWPCCERHLKLHESFLIPNYHFYLNDGLPGRKGGTSLAVRKCIVHNHVDLPLLASVETSGVCIPIGNSEVLLAAVHKPSGRAWSNADITELLSFGCKSTLGPWIYFISMNLLFQRHNVPLTILLLGTVTSSILWSIRIFGCQMSFSLMYWTPIMYQ